MSVKVTGMKKLLGDLENRLGKEALQQVSDKALLAGAEIFVDELKRQFETFKDQGYSLEEITVAGPMWEKGNRIVKIHWRGPHGRYRIIHLNEWGTVKNPNPPGKGKIALAMRNCEKAYIKAVKDAVRRGI
ncbi:HK97-gp10 family putative phage morphogenesis protein [Mesobacillus jeotgali]|uniref:hypothetical protein n=1 Tax=Mesobacillus jeotgali TaxID=129985 RepID=UPI001CFE363E|nr:hypothetical protein [Mesobacillus jeotgali]